MVIPCDIRGVGRDPATSSSVAEEPLSFHVTSNATRRPLSQTEASQAFSGLGEAPYVRASLGGCVIGDGAAVVVAEQLVKLASFHSLKHLSLADSFATLSDEEAVRALSVIIAAAGECLEISSLDVSENTLGSMGVSACATLFQSRRHCLQQLFLCRAGLGPDAMRLVRSFVATKGPTHIEVLRFDGNALGPQGVSYVANIIEVSPRLRDLSLSGVRADSDALLAILTALSAHISNLEYLNLSGNDCDSKTALGFANVFCANGRLREIVLRKMNLNDAAASLIVRAIASSPIPVEVLDLGCNELSTTCAIPLAFCIKAKANVLRTLLVDDNEFGDVGAIRFMAYLDGIKGSLLHNVSFAQNALSDLGGIAVGTAVAPMLELKALDLSGNHFQSQTLQALKSVFHERLVADEASSAQDPYTAAEEVRDIPSTEIEEPEMKAALMGLARAAERRSASDCANNGDVCPAPSGFEKSRLSSSWDAGMACESEAEDMLSGITDSKRSSGIYQTPVTGKAASRSSEMSSPDCFDSSRRPGLSTSAVISSARELRAQVNSLDMEVTNLVEELQAERRSSQIMDILQVDSRATSRAPEHETQPVKTLWSELIDVVWAFILAAFVLMIIFSLVQSQDELTFSLKPV
jgi:Ran GTPase-activating protein (RanGAP) involved in mRNA processing and transport